MNRQKLNNLYKAHKRYKRGDYRCTWQYQRWLTNKAVYGICEPADMLVQLVQLSRQCGKTAYSTRLLAEAMHEAK